MKTKFRSILNAAVAVTAVALIMSSCKKENEAGSPLKVQGVASVLACDTTQYTISSSTANPAGGTFAPIYLNAATGAQSTSSFGAATLLLDGNTNSTVKPISGSSTIRLLNSTSAICDLTAADWTAAGSNLASVGENTAGFPANGYFYYPSPGNPTAVSDVYVLVNDGTDIIAVKYRDIRGYVVTPWPGLTVRGEYDVTVRKIN